MIGIELVPALVFGVLAIRSALYWHRHRAGARDTADDVLFAVFVTGRVGTWLAAAGMFVLFGTINVRGRAFADEAAQYRWLFVVFLGLGAMQLIAAWFLSSRGAMDAEETPATQETGDEPRPPA